MWTLKSQIFAGFEEVDFFLEEEGVGAEIDVFFALDEAFDDFFDVGVEQRFAAGDGDHGGAHDRRRRRRSIVRGEDFS